MGIELLYHGSLNKISILKRYYLYIIFLKWSVSSILNIDNVTNYRLPYEMISALQISSTLISSFLSQLPAIILNLKIEIKYSFYIKRSVAKFANQRKGIDKKSKSAWSVTWSIFMTEDASSQEVQIRYRYYSITSRQKHASRKNANNLLQKTKTK